MIECSNVVKRFGDFVALDARFVERGIGDLRSCWARMARANRRC